MHVLSVAEAPIFPLPICQLPSPVRDIYNTIDSNKRLKNGPLALGSGFENKGLQPLVIDICMRH